MYVLRLGQQTVEVLAPVISKTNNILVQAPGDLAKTVIYALNSFSSLFGVLYQVQNLTCILISAIVPQWNKV